MILSSYTDLLVWTRFILAVYFGKLNGDAAHDIYYEALLLIFFGAHYYSLV